MYHLAHDGADPVPLDFNTPPRTDSVADALVSDPGLAEGPRAPAPESLARRDRPARSRFPPGGRGAVRSVDLRVRARPVKDESGRGSGESVAGSFLVINQYQGELQCLV